MHGSVECPWQEVEGGGWDASWCGESVVCSYVDELRCGGGAWEYNLWGELVWLLNLEEQIVWLTHFVFVKLRVQSILREMRLPQLFDVLGQDGKTWGKLAS
jgi:hypothetical protein